MPVLISPGGYPLPSAEEERAAEAATFERLGAGRAEGLDGVCELARELFDVPLAMISLVGRDDCQPLASSGPVPSASRRGDAFCAWTVASGEPTIVPDAGADPRFKTNPLVRQKSGCRFYAGAPLIVREGLAIGALALFDTRPREWTQAQTLRLQRLAALALSELRNRRDLAELARRENLVASAAHLTRVGSWAYDIVAAKLSWSSETCRILGLPEDEPPAVPALLACFAQGETRAWARQAFQDLQTTGESLDREVQVQGPLLEEPRWVRCLAEAERADGQIVRVVGSVQDVTDRREAEARIERLAYQDQLTGLPNRALFQQTVQSAIEAAARRGGQVGLVLLDLDHFKDVNDSLGHDVGDALLASVAERLANAYRKSDMVARLGGDEFAVILPSVNGPDDLTRPTRKVLELLRHPMEHDGRVLSISASVGAALLTPGGGEGENDAAQLLRNADIALFQAKAAGRNRIVAYEPQMRAAVEQRIDTLREVRAGLARAEFVLHYQPVVEIGPKGEIGPVTGFEALTRWNHPTRGLVTPEHFMAAFDDQQLALQFGECTLENALRQMRDWMDAGLEFGRIAVNVSTAQFRTGRLAEHIATKLAFWKVPAERLCIEVTETVYMGWGAEVVGEAARALHEMGVQVALDDFGTGYASLTHLKSFPIDRLKIDRSFVQGAEDREIVDAVATLGAKLGMTVVAEGVESAGQLAFLADAGCHQAQGFHIGRPMPPEDVPVYLATRPGRGAKPNLRLA